MERRPHGRDGGARAPRRAAGLNARDAALRDEAERVLRANWREGHRARTGGDGSYAFTCPATPRYRHMWHWDSCFHAIVWRLIDPARARAELRTILRSGRPDGFLPHTVFWDAPARWRRAPLYATETMIDPWRTATIGPPLVPFAWELVAASSPEDPGFASEALPALGAHLDWLRRERDLDGDGLLTIVVPDESGIDDSPKYEPIFGRMTHDRPGYALLMDRGRRAGWDARRMVAGRTQHVEDVWVNVAYALSLRAMGRLTGEAHWSERAATTERALVDRCLDRETGLFYDLAGADERPVPISTWSALTPLALDGLAENLRRRLVEEHLLDPLRYRAPVGIPSVAMDEPSFNPGFDRFRAWRGPSWVNTAWLLVPAMRRLGYDDDAARIVDGLADAAAGWGFREYYHPHTGRGLGARGFAWSTLLIDLLPAG